MQTFLSTPQDVRHFFPPQKADTLTDEYNAPEHLCFKCAVSLTQCNGHLCQKHQTPMKDLNTT